MKSKKKRIKKAPFAKKTCNPKSKSCGTKPTPEKNIPERIPNGFVNFEYLKLFLSFNKTNNFSNVQ